MACDASVESRVVRRADTDTTNVSVLVTYVGDWA